MGNWLERTRERLARLDAEGDDLRHLLAAWERAVEASNLVTADRDRLYRRIEALEAENAALRTALSNTELREAGRYHDAA